MARYYEITITDPSGANNPLAQTFSSLFAGENDPGALNVELDLVSSIMAVPSGNCTISIEGVPLSLLQQSANFSGLNISVKGGMFAPPGNQFQLIQPQQRGLLLQGQIFQSFGNWVGTDMNLNFVVVPSGYTFSRPGNFVFQWQQGQDIAQAIANTLNVAYNNPAILNRIGATYSPQGSTAVPGGRYKTLNDFAEYIKRLTRSSSSPGIDIVMLADQSILLYDQKGTQPKAAPVAFTDLIGQPKWVEPEVFQFTTVMRADIQVGSVVTMPPGMQSLPGIITTQASALPGPLKYRTSFQGNFLVNAVRHIGNFRDPDGSAWSSIFQAVPSRVD